MLYHIKKFEHLGGNAAMATQMKVSRWSRFVASALLVVGGTLLASVGTAGASGARAKSSSVPLTVGVFSSFSGANASFGPESYDPCLAAAAIVNSDGGVLGHQLTCKAADSRGDPVDGVPEAHKLASTTSNLVGVIGPDGGTAPTVVPIFGAAHLPMFPTTGSSEFNRQTDKYFWRVLPPDVATATALAIAAHGAGITRVASVFGDAATNETNIVPFANAFKKLGGKIAISLVLPSGQPSYSTQAAQVLAAHPQAIVTEADPQTEATFMKDLQQLTHKLPLIYGTSGTQYAAWTSAVGLAIGAKLLASIHYTATPFSPFSGVAYKLFKSSLLKTHTSNPAQFETDIFAMAAFDTVNIMALAMIEAKSTNPVVYNPFIEKVTELNAKAVVVNTFAQGKAALATGKSIRYVGATGSVVFNKYHNSPGEFALVKYTTKGASGAVQVVKLISTAEISKLS